MNEKINEKINGKIDKIVQEYMDVYKNKDTKFDKINILLPTFLFDIVSDGFKEIEQVRMANGIFITSIINDYFEYIQKLYDIEPSLYDEERLKYVRKQLHVTIIPDTVNTIDKIKKLVGTNDRVGVVKSAIEHYIRTNSNDITKEYVLKEDVLMDDD